MSELTKEQFEQLPEFIRGDYVEVDGAYKHAGLIKVKQTANELDSKWKSAQSQLDELSTKLNSFEEAKKSEIEKAKREAMEQARSKGDVEAIEKRYQEEMADLEKRVAERTRQEVEKEYSLKDAKNRAQLELSDIVTALKPVDTDAAELIKDHLRLRQRVDEDGKVVYLDDEGRATSLDKKGLIEEMRKSTRIARLIQSNVVTTGGGNANGSNGRANNPLAVKTGNRRADKAAAIKQKFGLNS